jgi:replicative DNA helicase
VTVSSPEIEAYTLGVILDSPHRFSTLEIFMPEFFTGDRYFVAKVINDVAASGRLPDIPTVAHELERQYSNNFQEMGGRKYLLELQLGIPYSTIDADQYIQHLAEEYRYRKLIDLGVHMERMGETRYGETSVEAITAAQEALIKISDIKFRDESYASLEQALDAMADVFVTRTETNGAITGIPSGFRDLDTMTMGFQKSDLSIIGARPAMGKTAIALNIAYHAAVANSVPTILFSLEMNTQDLIERIVSSITQISFSRLRKGILSENEWAAFSRTVNEIHKAPLFIDDSSMTSVPDIRGHCARMKAQYGYVGLVMVDYLGLMTDALGKHSNESRQQEVSQISRGLKLIARDFNCPVIAMSQLNRGVENRPNKRPMLSDLRESGSLEQDASTVLFLYRDEVYYQDSADQGIVEVILSKNRHGDKGTARLGFINNIVKFVNLSN